MQQESLKTFCTKKFQLDKPLHLVSTLGVGGPARFFYEVHQIEEMQAVLRYCFLEKLPFLILGKGSNCLFDDRGFAGLVILNKISFCEFQLPVVSVGAGYSFSLLGAQTAKQGFSGLEFASGIPGSVGGAVFMNAGANGQEVKDCLLEVTFINEKGELEILSKEQMQFSYRFSSLQHKKGAIVGVKFLLELSHKARQTQLNIIAYRTKTQPYHEKSAGCIFRNVELESAGGLIERCGLKGKRIGGAEVSSLHANFIVNKGGATANDILELAVYVRKIVKEKAGIDLEMEVRYIPYELTS